MFKQLYSQERTTWQEFSSDHEFIELRKNVSQDFEDLFKESYKLYIAGDWENAGKGFQKLVEERPYDGPSNNLHKVVNIRGKGKAPEDWKGFRPLTSK